jgi:hypothetical protein
MFAQDASALCVCVCDWGLTLLPMHVVDIIYAMGDEICVFLQLVCKCRLSVSGLRLVGVFRLVSLYAWFLGSQH